jgi:hypothetical protein
LLTATPVYDSIKDSFQLSNLLNGKHNQYDTSKLAENGLIELVDTNLPDDLYNNKVYGFTKKGEESIIRNLIGRVSFLKSDESEYPKVIYPNSTELVNNFKFSLPVLLCEMTGHQSKIYKLVVENVKFNPLGGDLESLASIIYPDSGGRHYYSKFGLDHYITPRGSKDFLLERNVGQYSSKLYQLLVNLKNSKGKVFISAKNISNDGIPVIAACLKENGYSKILVVTSKTEKISDNIKLFNSPENDNGSKIQILLGSSVISEGITLKNIRQVHIFEPGWNYSYIDQTIGRAVRRGSHSRLAVADRVVEVYLYCAIHKELLNKSVGYAKYLLSTIKDKQIKRFERMMAQNSFSCSAFKSRNIKINSVNGSRDCDYTDCSYTCNGTPSNTVDENDYDLKFNNKELYTKISKSLNEILSKTKVVNLTETNLPTAVASQVVKGDKMYKKFGNVVTFAKSNIKPKIGLISNKGKVSLKPKKGVKTTAEKLYIVYGKTDKICNTYDKPALLKMVSALGITLPSKVTKDSLCEILKANL